MSIESDAASQVVGIYSEGVKLIGQLMLKVGETILELSGDGARALGNHLIKAWQQEDKVGKVRLENFVKRVAKEGKTLQLFGTNITSKETFKAVKADLDRLGLSYTVIEKANTPRKKKDRDKNTNYYEFMVCAEDAPILNHIIERHGLNLVQEQEETNDHFFEKEENKSQPEVSPLYEDEQEYTSIDDFLNDILDEKSKSKTEDIVLNEDEQEVSNAEIFLDEILNDNKTIDISDVKKEKEQSRDSYVDEYYNGKNKDLSNRLEKDVIEIATVDAFIDTVLDKEKELDPTLSSEKKGQSGLELSNEKAVSKPSLLEGLKAHNEKKSSDKSLLSKEAPALPKLEFKGKD